MPVYVLYRGDCSNFAFDDPNHQVFTALDALGREWLCVNTGREETDDDWTSGLPDVLAAQHAAHKQGLSSGGTEMMVLHCTDEADLRRQLVLATYPRVEESADRLRRAGWTSSHLAWGTGRPPELTLANGRETFIVHGATEDEAWFRAALLVFGFRPGGWETPTMTLTVHTDPVPLRTDEHGTIRVGSSQVLLDVVIEEFENGATPAEIAEGYPTLQLPDVYAVVAYYLRHRSEVDAYLQAREREAEELRKVIEAKKSVRPNGTAPPPASQEEMEQGHASPGK